MPTATSGLYLNQPKISGGNIAEGLNGFFFLFLFFGTHFLFNTHDTKNIQHGDACTLTPVFSSYSLHVRPERCYEIILLRRQ